MFVKGSKPAPFIGLQQSLATREAEFRGQRGPYREWTGPMFEENEVLTQIRALRQEVGSRLDDMDQRLRKIEAELASPAMQGFGSRLDEVDRRLQRVESELSAPFANAVPSGSFTPEPRVEQAPPVPTHTVQMTISPLNDVAHVSVVEAALRAIVGVESATLQSLKGDGAEIAVEVQEDVSLIGGLRRTLPVAFDVSEADDSSFTLGLVQPAGEKRGDAVVQKTL
jgi:tetrahydromethanopterin S-methyltransferase subunit G